MARYFFLLYHFSRRRFSDSFRGFFFIPTSLALITSLFVLFYISSTSNLFIHPHQTHLHLKFPLGSSRISHPTTEITQISVQIPSTSVFRSPKSVASGDISNLTKDGGGGAESQWAPKLQLGSSGNFVNDEVFHDRDIFMEDYKEMNRSLKIYVYPHRRDDPFANALLPVDFEPGGNYASEGSFKKVLMKSHFIKSDLSEADLFFLPFSIARLRHDLRVGIGLIQDFIRDYIFNISRNYPYWNRTGGADHFYVACHSIGQSAMEKADEVKFNAIQLVCSSCYFLSKYIAHKDASLPQIWSRQGDPRNLASSKRGFLVLDSERFESELFLSKRFIKWFHGIPSIRSCEVQL